ncbi:MAG TPA: HIT domain-containing protein [archaeon]|nr:HIT domain-containing protein [archaeon]
MENCIFCAIVAGKVPAFKIYEDEKFLAFLDIRPLNPGHTLLIPKTHYRWVWDVPDAGEYFEVVKKIATAMKKSFQTEWVVSTVIGEAVEHAHIQIIPRFPEDGHGGAINWTAHKQIAKEQMEYLAEKIKEAL